MVLPSELEITAWFVATLSIVLLVKVFFTFRPVERSPWESTLDDMINGYELSLPKEVGDYEKLKAQLAKPLSAITPDERKGLCAALFKRAMADVPLASKLQNDSHGMTRLKRSDVLRDAAFDSFKGAEAVIDREIKAVQKEALALKPGMNWGKDIFPQAASLYRKMNAQKQEAEEQAKADVEKKRLMQEKEAMDSAEVTREDKKRAKAIAALMGQEGDEAAMAASGPSTGSKKKN